MAGAAVWYFVFYNTDRIGGRAAEDAALAHAGFSRNEVSALKSDYEHDDGLRYYEVSFVRDTTEYEYAIDSVTGEVLNVKRSLYLTELITSTSSTGSRGR